MSPAFICQYFGRQQIHSGGAGDHGDKTWQVEYEHETELFVERAGLPEITSTDLIENSRTIEPNQQNRAVQRSAPSSTSKERFTEARGEGSRFRQILFPLMNSISLVRSFASMKTSNSGRLGRLSRFRRTCRLGSLS